MDDDRFLSDLEARMLAQERREIHAEILDFVEAEKSQTHISQLLIGAYGAELRCTILDGTVLDGELAEVGDDWIILKSVHAKSLIRVSAISSIMGMPRGPIAVAPQDRNTLGSYLRTLVRERKQVRWYAHARQWHGRIAVVGKDWVEFISAAPQETLLLPIGAMQALIWR